jgi:hypothetical protein
MASHEYEDTRSDMGPRIMGAKMRAETARKEAAKAARAADRPEQRIEALKGVLASLFASQRTLKSLAPNFKWAGLGNASTCGTT